MGLEQGVQNINSRGVRSSGGGSTATLLEIKTLAQTIADKGWACISQTKTLSKTTNPTIYAEIEKKLETVEKEMSNISISSGIKSVCFQNDKFYFITSNTLYVSSNLSLSNAQEIDIEQSSLNNYKIAMGNNINILTDGKKYLIYDKNWEYIKTITRDTEDTGISLATFVDGEFYFSFYTAENYDFTRCFLEKVEDSVGVSSYTEIYNKSSFSGYHLAFYNISIIDDDVFLNGVYKTGTGQIYGDSYAQYLVHTTKSDFTQTDLKTGITSGKQTNVVKYETKYYFATKTKIYESTDKTTWAESQSLSVSQAHRIIQLGDKYYIFYASAIYTTTNFATFDEYKSYGTTISDALCINAYMNDNNFFICFSDNTNSYLYAGFTIKLFIDNINGNEIDYYKASDGTKIITDLTQTSEISAVKSFLGCFNYFILDTTNETVTLPYNSNLWTYMYVGDDYTETSFPEGNATRLLPQAEVISVSSATPSFTSSSKLKTNADYQCGTITSLTFDTNSVDDSQLETTIRFTAGTSFEFSYVNAGVKINGELQTFEEGGEYIILIVNKTIFVSDKIVAGV